MPFQPDTQHMLDVLANRRPARLPIYEHVISPKIMQQVLDVRFEDLEGGDRHDLKEFFRHCCRFWPGMGYDMVSYETCITQARPPGVTRSARATRSPITSLSTATSR